MIVTQISHNDLDGYGASTVVAAFVPVDRVVHVTRYRDVPAIFGMEIARLRDAEASEMLIITDIAIERATAAMIREFAVMNSERPGHEHRLVVLDHHASSVTWLTTLGFHALPEREPDQAQACYYTVPGQDLGDPNRPDRDPIVVLIDDTRSATKIAYDHARIYAGEACRVSVDSEMLHSGVSGEQTIAALVAGVDAVDLWHRDDPAFGCGEAINEGFWEVVGSFIPEGHELHDRFVSMILIGLAGLTERHGLGKRIEIDGMAVRSHVVNRLIKQAGLKETPDQAGLSTRMRIARLVGHSTVLFADLASPVATKIAFAMDPGIFQRTADEMLRDGRAALVINVLRGGQMSLRSRSGEALDLAALLSGGGHANSAGAQLTVGPVFSRGQAKSACEAQIGLALAQL